MLIVLDGDQTVDQILIKLFLASMLTGMVQSGQASKTSEIEVEDKEARAKLRLDPTDAIVFILLFRPTVAYLPDRYDMEAVLCQDSRGSWSTRAKQTSCHVVWHAISCCSTFSLGSQDWSEVQRLNISTVLRRRQSPCRSHLSRLIRD